jgi:hypothetical protein
MFDEVNRSIDEYLGKWQALIDARKDENNKEFFERLKPTAAGWKTTDLADFDRLLSSWREACDHMPIARLNDRWIAQMHLRDQKLHGDIQVIKLMQRRPESSDAVGLDHLDFMDMELTNTKAILAEEDDLKWTDEQNGLCVWTSIWFDGTEAKLREGTVIDVSIAELQAVNNKIRGEKFAVGERVHANTVVAE